jgi:hypothetical protein
MWRRMVIPLTSPLKIQAVLPSEISIDLFQPTQRRVTKDGIGHSQRIENFNYNINKHLVLFWAWSCKRP